MTVSKVSLWITGRKILINSLCELISHLVIFLENETSYTVIHRELLYFICIDFLYVYVIDLFDSEIFSFNPTSQGGKEAKMANFGENFFYVSFDS